MRATHNPRLNTQNALLKDPELTTQNALSKDPKLTTHNAQFNTQHAQLKSRC